MKAAFVFAVAGVLVAAQDIDLSSLPECSANCITAALAEVGCTDAACACDADTQSALIGPVSTCVTENCPDELSALIAAQSGLCASAGGSSGSATESATESATDSAATESATESATATESGAETTETADETGADEATETAEETADETADGTAEETDAATNTSSTATPTPETGAAAKGSVIGLLALVAGFVAAL